MKKKKNGFEKTATNHRRERKTKVQLASFVWFKLQREENGFVMT
jgi:hypothetical protein